MAGHQLRDRRIVAPVGVSLSPAPAGNLPDGLGGTVGAGQFFAHPGSLAAFGRDSSGKIWIRCCFAGETGPQYR